MKSVRLISSLAAAVLMSLHASAQTPINLPNKGGPTYITPYYFGPNAFPVPEVLEGTESSLKGEVLAHYSRGYLTDDPDHATDLGFKVVIPLWTDRVNISAWGQAREWYWDNPSVREVRRVDPSKPLHGNAIGDVCFSTDILLMREGARHPGVVFRAAVKTASGDSYDSARYYDSAGYFFDIYLFKDLIWNSGAFFPGVRLSAGGGFLCWQTDNGRQNDAALLAASLTLYSKVADLNVQLGGYQGWERLHDFPVAFKASLTGHSWRYVNPVLKCQVGLNDYPFIQVGGGISITIDQWKYWIAEKE